MPLVLALEKRMGRPVAQAAVFIALSRLEKKGLVASRLDEPDGRPRRRYFRLTKRGLTVVKEARTRARAPLARARRRLLGRTRPDMRWLLGCWSATPIAGRSKAIWPSSTSSAGGSDGERAARRWLRRQRVLYPAAPARSTRCARPSTTGSRQ